MADTPETPTTTETHADATSRRRTTRKTAAAKAPSTRRTPRTSAAEKAGDTVTAAATETGRRVRTAAAKAEGAVASAATETARRTRRGAAKAEGAVAAAAGAVKPRSSSRAKPRRERTSTGRSSGKKGSRWGVAAVAGGLAAAGVAAALLTRKGGDKSIGGGISPIKPGEPIETADTGETAGGAHQPNGIDSSRSFDAKIADENTIPGNA